MNVHVRNVGSRSVFRIDRFECPKESLTAFEDRLALIHGYFDTLAGCLYNKVAVTIDGDRIEIVTIVEWEDEAALRQARSAVANFYEKTGFDPAAFMAERGITGKLGLFHPVSL
ncbi:antibiotic biosynthesis monooxygenase [Pseudomonas sp. R2.Fl]|nr:antibiotic biosynthesis monooxygenase [Pseudomonas sp. R2.Fl]